MKKRIFRLISEILIASVLGIWLQLLLHEAGHALFAILSKGKIVGVKIGIVSYVDVFVKNKSDFIIISIGAYIFLYVIWLMLYFINENRFFINMLRTIIFICTTIQLAINTAIIFILDNSRVLEYDIGKFIYYSNINKYLVCGILIAIIITTSICEILKIIKVYDKV